jgi:hypothetical protein
MNYGSGVVNMRQTPGLLTGLAADMPAPALKGRKYFATDTAIIWEDSGTAWGPYIGGGGAANWNTVLSLLGSFSADRSADMANFFFKLISNADTIFAALPGGDVSIGNTSNLARAWVQASASAKKVLISANNAGGFAARLSTVGLLADADVFFPDGNGIFLYNAHIQGGLTSFNGDGVTQSFNIPHGLTAAPNRISVTVGSADAAKEHWVNGISVTDINIRYAIPPIVGVNNVSFYWTAML